MKLMLTVCHRISLFPLLITCFLFFLYLIGNAQEFLDTSQLMLLYLIRFFSVFTLAASANLLLVSGFRLVNKNKAALAYFLYAFISFLLVLAALTVVRAIWIWI